jgi:hypothetical protein
MALPTLDELSAVMLPNEVQMVWDVINAANVTENIKFLKSYVPKTGGFMFSSPTPEMQAIYDAMTYQGHSGTSHAWAVRTAQTILRHGLDIYVNEVNGRPDYDLHLRYFRESLPFKLNAAENERDYWEQRVNEASYNTENDIIDRLSIRLSEANETVNNLRSQMAFLV